MGGALKFYYCNFHLILNNYYLGALLRHASGRAPPGSLNARYFNFVETLLRKKMLPLATCSSHIPRARTKDY
jgi:hypothetical protein